MSTLLIRVRVEHDEWNFIGDAGEFIFPMKLIDSEDFTSSERLALVRLPSLKWNYINAEGKLFSQNGFLSAYSFREGRAAVQLNDKKWWYVDSSGEFLFGGFDNATNFNEGVAIVKTKDKWNVIDKTGQVLVKNIKNAKRFSHGCVPAQTSDDKWVYLNAAGALKFPSRFESAESFSDGFAVVMTQDGEWNYIDTDGRFLFPKPFRIATPYRNGIAFVMDFHGKWNVIDLNGNCLLKDSVECYQIERHVDGVTQIRSGLGAWNFLDEEGRRLFSKDFFYSSVTDDDVCVVGRDNSYNYFSFKERRILFSQNFRYAWDFVNGVALVETRNGKYVNKSGKFFSTIDEVIDQIFIERKLEEILS